MQKNNSFTFTILIVVATIIATIFVQNFFKFDIKNEISISDILSLIFNGLLAYYIGTAFVRFNDKNKTIREFLIKEVLDFFDKTKICLNDIKGFQNDFVYLDTSIRIQNVRDQILYILSLNESLFNDQLEVRKKLDDLSQNLRQMDLITNSGMGAQDPATFLVMQNNYETTVNEIRKDFANLLKLIS